MKFCHTSQAFLLKNPVTLAIFRISLPNAFGKLVFLGRLKAEELEMEVVHYSLVLKMLFSLGDNP